MYDLRTLEKMNERVANLAENKSGTENTICSGSIQSGCRIEELKEVRLNYQQTTSYGGDAQ